MKHSAKRSRSMGVKLFWYFALFAAGLMGLLWLLQIVFLQSFYERMKTNNVVKTAQGITERYGDDDFAAYVDRVTFRNSMLVYLIDADDNVIYSSDEHGAWMQRDGAFDGGMIRWPHGNGAFDPAQGADAPPSQGGTDAAPTDAPDPAHGIPPFGAFPFGQNFRPLPLDYEDFKVRLSQAANGTVVYTENSARFAGKSLIYGAALDGAVLYISSPIDPVNATTEILSQQLLVVTAVALVLALVLAYFIARRFARPVLAISRQAAELSHGHFDLVIEKGFTSEIDELAATLEQVGRDLSQVESIRREFIANVSHDLRTPLTMIKAYTEMIRDISGENRPKREAHLAVIASEADRLSKLVDDLLALSVLQAGYGALERDNVDLSDIALRVAESFAPIFERDAQQLRTRIEPDQYVQADEQRITQVLYNLVANARSYIGDDGIIELAVLDRGGWVRCEVIDHGNGIPPDEVARIWDRYYKAKDQKDGRNGTGLGLSIVKNLLELHDARYGVHSVVGEGSVFWFEMRK